MRLRQIHQGPASNSRHPGLAQTYNHSQIEPEHLLLALLQQPDGVVPEVITQAGAIRGSADPARSGPGAAAQGVRRQCPTGRKRQASRVFQDAQSEAAAMYDDYVSTEHLLLALAGKNGDGAAKLLAGWASRAIKSWLRYPRSAAASASPTRTRRPRTRRWRSMAAT